MNLKSIRKMQIIGLILTFIGVILNILGFLKTYLSVMHPLYCEGFPYIDLDQIPLLAWWGSVVLIIAGMILFLIMILSLFKNKDNNQKKKNLKATRLMQIIGLILILIGVVLSILGLLKIDQSIIPQSPVSTWCSAARVKIDQIPLLTWSESIVLIIAGMILFLITTISLFLIKDNTQKNLILEKKK